MNVMGKSNIDELAEEFTAITVNLQYRKSNGKGFNQYSDDDKDEWLQRIYSFSADQIYNNYYYDVLRCFVTITNYSVQQSISWLSRYLHIIQRNYDKKITSFDTVKEIATMYTTPHLCPVCHKYEFKYYSSFEPCPICHWLDYHDQEENADKREGMNNLSLNEAIEAYKNGKTINF